MNRRGFGGVVRAVRKQGEAARLARLGLSDAMWEALQDLHLARLERDRGRRASPDDRTLAALYSRGLASYSRLEGEDALVLWATTSTGADLVKRGRD